eukprot:m.66405 g.66405  ORF g.66405 m.66405 type:complete len:542 (+) comp14051_c0_seq1:294-1919(+)
MSTFQQTIMRLSRCLTRARKGSPRAMLAVLLACPILWLLITLGTRLLTITPAHPVAVRPITEDCVALMRSQSQHDLIKTQRCLSRQQAGLHHNMSGETTIREMCLRPSVAWDSPIDGGLTYGLASEAVSFLVPLADHADITLVGDFRADSSFVAGLDPIERTLLKKLKAIRRAKLLPHEPTLHVSQWAPGSLWRNKLRSYGPSDHVYRISRAMYEATHVPSDWKPNFNEIDEWWVPYTGMKDILVDNHKVSANRIFVVEEGLDTELTFNPGLFDRTLCRQRVYPADVQRHFIFLSVFKWEERKAYKELIRAFSTAFPLDVNVTLFLRTSPPGDNLAGVVKGLLDGEEDPRIRLLPRQQDHRYQQMLMGADAFVLATHGEGWGRPLMEAMAMGLPSVATNWSGPTQFMTEKTGYLIPVKKMIKAEGLPGAVPEAEWAEVNIKALAGTLKHIYDKPRAAAAMGRRARQHIIKHYDQKIIMGQVLARLQQACERQAKGFLPRIMDKEHIHPHHEKHETDENGDKILRNAPKSSDWIYQWGRKKE